MRRSITNFLARRVKCQHCFLPGAGEVGSHYTADNCKAVLVVGFTLATCQGHTPVLFWPLFLCAQVVEGSGGFGEQVEAIQHTWWSPTFHTFPEYKCSSRIRYIIELYSNNCRGTCSTRIRAPILITHAQCYLPNCCHPFFRTPASNMCWDTEYFSTHQVSHNYNTPCHAQSLH